MAADITDHRAPDEPTAPQAAGASTSEATTDMTADATPALAAGLATGDAAQGQGAAEPLEVGEGDWPELAPSLSYRRVPQPGGGRDRYADVRCAGCASPLAPVWDDMVAATDGTWAWLQVADALHLRITGGYGELIDISDEPELVDASHLIFCAGCVHGLTDTVPALATVLLERIGGGATWHRCLDGTMRWEPLDECTVDPLRHGWAQVWVVTAPAKPARTRAQRLGHRVTHGVHWDQEAAQAHTDQLTAAGVEVTCRQELVGSLDLYRTPDGSALTVPAPPPTAPPVDTAPDAAAQAAPAGDEPAEGWSHTQARGHDVVERLHERCATYAGATCTQRSLPEVDWCERCLAAAELLALREQLPASGR